MKKFSSFFRISYFDELFDVSKCRIFVASHLISRTLVKGGKFGRNGVSHPIVPQTILPLELNFNLNLIGTCLDWSLAVSPSDFPYGMVGSPPLSRFCF